MASIGACSIHQDIHRSVDAAAPVHARNMLKNNSQIKTIVKQSRLPVNMAPMEMFPYDITKSHIFRVPDGCQLQITSSLTIDQ